MMLQKAGCAWWLALVISSDYIIILRPYLHKHMFSVSQDKKINNVYTKCYIKQRFLHYLTYKTQLFATFFFHLRSDLQHKLFSKRNATFLKLPFFWRRVHASQLLIHVYGFTRVGLNSQGHLLNKFIKCPWQVSSFSIWLKKREKYWTDFCTDFR